MTAVFRIQSAHIYPQVGRKGEKGTYPGSTTPFPPLAVGKLEGKFETVISVKESSDGREETVRSGYSI